jgi:hypothetical protein
MPTSFTPSFKTEKVRVCGADDKEQAAEDGEAMLSSPEPSVKVRARVRAMEHT